MLAYADLVQFWHQFIDPIGVRMRRSPPHYTVGGAIQLSSVNVPQQAILWESGDGVAKPVTLLLTAPPLSINSLGMGVYGRVRIGDEKGAMTMWIALPTIQTFVCKSMQVDLILAKVPYNVYSPGATMPAQSWPSLPIQPQYFTEPESNPITVTCVAREGTPSADPPILPLLNNVQLDQEAGAVQLYVPGPVFISTLEFNNQATSGVAIVWAEASTTSTGGAPLSFAIVGSCIVPAGASLGVSSAMLGSFASGMGIYAVTDLTNPSTRDPNGVHVTVNCSGFYLSPA